MLRTLSRGVIAAIAASSLLTPVAHANDACQAHAAGAHAHLVELYTSEGCSSCPPADAWLRTVDASRAVALAFHVDYWDGLGWRDRFADAGYTARQNAQARREHGDTVYTPQVVLDGRSWPHWSGASLPATSTPGDLALDVAAAVQGDAIRVRTRASGFGAALAPSRVLLVALVEDGLVSRVDAGENRGVTLQHDHVVRALSSPLPLAPATALLARPRDLEMTRASLVAFVQDTHDGRIGQLAVLPLAGCAAALPPAGELQ